MDLERGKEEKMVEEKEEVEVEQEEEVVEVEDQIASMLQLVQINLAVAEELISFQLQPHLHLFIAQTTTTTTITIITSRAAQSSQQL